MDRARFVSIINFLAGLYLIFSPLWISYTVAGNAWQQVILGFAVAVLALGRMVGPVASWASWANVAAGVYLIIVPWVIGASTAATWNQVILGIIIAAVGIMSATSAATAGMMNAGATNRPAGAFYERMDGDDRPRRRL